MGLVNEPAEFLHANGGDADVVDQNVDLLRPLYLDSPFYTSLYRSYCHPIKLVIRHHTFPYCLIRSQGQIASSTGPYPPAEQGQSQPYRSSWVSVSCNEIVEKEPQLSPSELTGCQEKDGISRSCHIAPRSSSSRTHGV